MFSMKKKERKPFFLCITAQMIYLIIKILHINPGEIQQKIWLLFNDY